jgi:hypothetical protein
MAREMRIRPFPEMVGLRGGFMDLRIVKTRAAIREAFLGLRAKGALERIRVTDLCRFAVINKTTFYTHYPDIYALSEEIENETLRSILDGFAHVDSLFNDPYGFVKGLYGAFKPHEELIKTLFADGRMNILVDKVEQQLKRHYPSVRSSPEKDIMLSFLLRGASQILMTSSKYKEAILLDTVATITKRIIALLGPGGGAPR